MCAVCALECRCREKVLGPLRRLPWGLGIEPHSSASVAELSLQLLRQLLCGCWDSNSGPYTHTAHTAEHLCSSSLGFGHRARNTRSEKNVDSRDSWCRCQSLPWKVCKSWAQCDRTYNFRGRSGGGMIFHTGDTGLPRRPQEPGLGRCSVGVTEPIFLGL